jgi:anti-sigma regulatory factor (Ser/Thr protein kinase)
LEVIQDSSSIRIELQSLPSSVTLVRAMLSGIGERFDLDPELVDELKTAVSEACNNVVLHAYPDEAGPLTVELGLDRHELRLTVIDRGTGIRQVAATADRMGVGLAVISALADRAEFESEPGVGTAVKMCFSARGRPFAVLAAGGAGGAGGAELGVEVNGDVRLTVTPVTLLGDVLGRVSRALAASAHFSLDRFSDLYLITDEISAHARSGAAGEALGCALTSAAGRLEMVVGPFRTGTMAALADGRSGTAYSFSKLVDRLSIEPAGTGELLRVLVVDKR